MRHYHFCPTHQADYTCGNLECDDRPVRECLWCGVQNDRTFGIVARTAEWRPQEYEDGSWSRTLVEDEEVHH